MACVDRAGNKISTLRDMKFRIGFSLALALFGVGVSSAQDNSAKPATNAAPSPEISIPAPAPLTIPEPTAAPAAEKKAESTPAKEKKAPEKKKVAKPSKPATTPATAPAPETVYTAIGNAVVKNENVNVRGKPAFIGEVITKLKKGETVTLLEEIRLKQPKKDEPTNWFRISLPTNTPVWVHADYIDEATKSVKPARLNVRTGPGENFSVIARMKKGDEVKQLRKVNDWIEIEAPTNAFAFVAAEFLEKQTIVPTAPAPTELAVVPPTETVNVPEPEAVKPVTEVPAQAPEKPAEVPAPAEKPAEVVAPTPAPTEQPAETVVKRVVVREGYVRKARNIQAPTYFELEGIDTKKVINYLHSPEDQQMDDKTKKMKSVPKFNLDEYVGRRVMISGEEFIDRRWKATPVIEIQTIDLEQ